MSAIRFDRAVFRRSAVGFVVAMAGLGLPLPFVGVEGPAARAQTKEIEPRQVVVVSPEVSIRCGAGDVWYPIGQAKAGDILTVDGESFGWLRVRYPASFRALAPADEAEVVQGRSAVRLTKPSSLFAYNPHADVRDSWKRLLSEKLTPGTELQLVQTLNDSSGRIAGYLVAAPAGSRGFVSEQSVRMATEAEIQAAAARMQQQQQAKAPESAPRVEPPQQTQQQASAPAKEMESAAVDAAPAIAERPAQEQQAPAVDQTMAPVAERPLVSVPQQTQQQPQQTIEPAPTASAPAPEIREAAPLVTMTPEAGAAGAAANAPEEEREIGTFEQLDRAFKAVIDEPIEGAELDPLISEHTRLMESLEDTEDNVSMRRAISARIELLQLRLELQQTLQKLASVEEKASMGSDEISRRVEEYVSSRQYVVVGRLMASSVYNGERLPLMYRLISIDGEAGRTVAYIAPDDAVDLKGKLGSIVGVEGDGRMDPSLRLSIIHPKRVDVLTSAPTE